jgi:hypothetical protein
MTPNDTCLVLQRYGGKVRSFEGRLTRVDADTTDENIRKQNNALQSSTVSYLKLNEFQHVYVIQTFLSYVQLSLASPIMPANKYHSAH